MYADQYNSHKNDADWYDPAAIVQNVLQSFGKDVLEDGETAADKGSYYHIQEAVHAAVYPSKHDGKSIECRYEVLECPNTRVGVLVGLKV